jgi:hypothetical protein
VPNQTGQYQKYNGFLLAWFNNALASFPQNYTQDDLLRHFPWNGAWNNMQATQVTWGPANQSATNLFNQAVLNPFLGTFTPKQTEPANPAGCDVTQFGPVSPGIDPPTCTNTGTTRGDHYLYPRQCNLADLAVTSGDTNVPRLRACSLNFETHHNGWLLEWPQSFWSNLPNGLLGPNQYGRTSFLFAGVPGMQLPVSFYNKPSIANGLSVYEQVYNASIFSLYLPIANEADFRNAFIPRNYTALEFYHTLLMTNHMESDPDEFAEGLRGKVLWHNEYRTQSLYAGFGARMFPAGFAFDPTNPDPNMPPAPFHNNTCDGCHVRNGSGIPIKPAPTLASNAYTLDAWLQPAKGGFMTGATYAAAKDYTFSGQILPMKLVFFDLQRSLPPSTLRLDDSVYSKPLAASQVAQAPLVPSAVKIAFSSYKNTIMNFYGDSFK